MKKEKSENVCDKRRVCLFSRHASTGLTSHGGTSGDIRLLAILVVIYNPITLYSHCAQRELGGELCDTLSRAVQQWTHNNVTPTSSSFRLYFNIQGKY